CLSATLGKIYDKLRGGDSDHSHALALAAALGLLPDAGRRITVDALAPFYRVLFKTADEVYGHSAHDVVQKQPVHKSEIANQAD
ncbi:MAG: hypothetical protein ACREIC_01355, partial [Limisphaerales bacterium]